VNVKEETEDRLRVCVKAQLVKLEGPKMIIAVIVAILVWMGVEIYSLYQTRVGIDEKLSAYAVVAQCQGESNNAQVLEKDGGLFLYCGFSSSIPGVPVPK